MSSPNILVDSHCHIDFPDFSEDLDGVLERAAEKDVAYLLCVSVELEKFHKIKALTQAHDHIFSSIGTHPNSDCRRFGEPQVNDLVGRSSDSAVVAIGETGLDYFRSKGDLDWQKDRFRVHVRASKEFKGVCVGIARASGDTVLLASAPA